MKGHGNTHHQTRFATVLPFPLPLNQFEETVPYYNSQTRCDPSSDIMAGSHEQVKRGTHVCGVPLERVEWLPERNDLRTKDLINSTSYKEKTLQKSPIEEGLNDNKIHEVNKPKKHIIHKAIEWKRMFDTRSVKS